MVLAATAIPQLSLLNKWYMLLFVPVVCSVHAAFMTTSWDEFWQGSRVWKFIFMGLLTFEIIGAIFVCDMPHDVGTAFYAVLSFVLMVVFEHLAEFIAEFFDNNDIDCDDWLSENMKTWDWYVFGRKLGVALWVGVFAAFFGLAGYVAEVSFSYSMWHLLWTIPCMMIVTAIITGFVDRIGFGFISDTDVGGAVSVLFIPCFLFSFIYATVVVCRHTFSFGIFCFLLLMFVVHAVAAFVSMIANMMCGGADLKDY